MTNGATSELAIRNSSAKRRHSEIAGGSSKADEPQQKRKMSLQEITALRRKSTGGNEKSIGGNEKSAGDVDIFGNPKVARRGSESKNTYDEKRDPRRKKK